METLDLKETRNVERRDKSASIRTNLTRNKSQKCKTEKCGGAAILAKGREGVASSVCIPFFWPRHLETR